MGQLVRDRLDVVSKALPEQPEKVPFEQYMAQAAARAAADPAFKQQYDRALKQYQALGG